MSALAPTPTILVFTSEASEAERIGSALREGGLPARTLASGQLEQLEESLTRHTVDIMVCCAYESAVNLDAVLAAHRLLAADLPLVLIEDPALKPIDIVKARRAGIRDSALRSDPDHLVALLKRELADLAIRREARGLQGRLAQCEQRGRELIDISSDPIAFVQEGLHVQANEAYLRLFGCTGPEDLEATPFLDLIAPDERKQVRDFLRQVEYSEQREMSVLAVTCLRSGGDTVTATLNAAQSEIDGDPCLRLVVKSRDPSVQAAPAERPEASALTRGGRAALLARIEDMVHAERAVPRPFTVFYLRVRGFADRSYNLGLNKSLEQIDALGNELAELTNGLGFVARITDDGFGLIVEDVDETSSEALCAQLRRDVRLPTRRQGAGGGDNQPDCDLGYCLVRGRAPNAEDILNTAHRLCLQQSAAPVSADAGHFTKTSLATRTKQPAEEGDAEIAEKIRLALRDQRFKLVYQPIISLMGDSQEHYSVLVRFIDAEDKLYEAKDFIGPAIRNGLIEEIDKWAVRESVRVIGEQRRAGNNLGFFVNLAEDTFRNPNIIIWICDCLREFDVRGSWVTFQFQEELVTGNLGSLGKLVDALKKIRCRVAVNHFGTSDHPEILLQGLPADFILFAPELATGLAEDAAKQQRLTSLANLAREFNVRSIVTGVEDARTLTVLWTAGIDYVQGNFLQRPSPTLEVQT